MEKSEGYKTADEASTSAAERLSLTNKLDEGVKLYDSYEKALEDSGLRAFSMLGRSSVNYVPVHNSIILRGESDIKISDLLKPDPKEVFKSALGFKFTVAAYGPEVKNLRIGDSVDIKNTTGLSLSPFIPNERNIRNLREKYKSDRDAMIAHSIKGAEDKSKVGSVLIKTTLDDKPNKVIDLNEKTVTIIEHFATEDYNISGILYLVK